MKKDLQINDVVYIANVNDCSIMGFKVISENIEFVRTAQNVVYFKSYCMARNLILDHLTAESKSLVEKRQIIMKQKKKETLVLGL